MPRPARRTDWCEKRHGFASGSRACLAIADIVNVDVASAMAAHQADAYRRSLDKAWPMGARTKKRNEQADPH